MKKALTYALTTLVLMMTFSLVAHAGHHNVARLDATDAKCNKVTQTATGYARLRRDGHHD